jgi:hypothetical protein
MGLQLEFLVIRTNLAIFFFVYFNLAIFLCFSYLLVVRT